MPCRVGLLQGGVPAPGGGVPGGPPQTATAAGGTHPTGMHSCLCCGLIVHFANAANLSGTNSPSFYISLHFD